MKFLFTNNYIWLELIHMRKGGATFVALFF